MLRDFIFWFIQVPATTALMVAAYVNIPWGQLQGGEWGPTFGLGIAAYAVCAVLNRVTNPSS